MRRVLLVLSLIAAVGCGDDDRPSFGGGLMPSPPLPRRDLGSADDGGVPDGDGGPDAGLPFGCVVLPAGSGPNVGRGEPFTPRSASALFPAAPSCDMEAILTVFVFESERCNPDGAVLQIIVPVENPLVTEGEAFIGFETTPVQMSYIDTTGAAFGASVETSGTLTISVIPTRTTPEGTPITFAPDVLLGATTSGASPVQITGSFSVPLGAQFSCTD